MSQGNKFPELHALQLPGLHRIGFEPIETANIRASGIQDLRSASCREYCKAARSCLLLHVRFHGRQRVVFNGRAGGWLGEYDVCDCEYTHRS